MALTTGTRLGSYEIVALLGAGGMGEVYRAHDTHLNRDVALKILLGSVVGDAERVARFTREAHVLASLNHPHIAHLYGFEAGPPTSFLVMELVEGPTLADLISAVPAGLPVDQVLAIARQIADALEAAHEQGIVHRDLKPANVKVRDDGTVKVLDFGLAAVDPRNPGPGTTDDANASTVLSPVMTTMGMILGTAAYMAPEQAKGKAVDKRADIWAFGAVLYEMLTGRRAFDGDDVSEVMASVLKTDPDWSALPADLPPAMRRLLRQCLEKDPKQRIRDMGDVRLLLASLSAGVPDEVAASTTVAVVPAWRRALPWALVAALSVTLVAVSLRDRLSTSATPGIVRRLQINLPPGVELYNFYGTSVSISPDGKTLAFVGVRDGIRQVFRRELDQFETAPVPGTEKATSVGFSPDGRQLLVNFSDTSLHRIRLSDSRDEMIAPESNDYRSAWLPNDRVVFAVGGRLWMSGATLGAPPTQLTQARAGSTEIETQPAAVPGGKAVLFVSVRPDAPDNGRIEALSLADGVRTTVVVRAASPVLTSAGDLLFLRDGVLVSAPFDGTSLKTTGDATPVLSDLNIDRTRTVPSGMMAVSRTGVLVYASTTAVPGDIVSVSRGREEQVERTPMHSAANPRMAPTGARLVYEEIGNGLWLWDPERHTAGRLAGSAAQFPIFTRDGREVIFRMAAGLFRQPLDRGAKAAQIEGSGASEFPSGTSLKDAELLYTKITAATSGDIYAIPLGGGTPRALVNTKAYEGGAELSPDGQWMVYVSNENDGVNEIFVTPYPSLSSRTQVSLGGGIQPMWNPNPSLRGLEILYRNGEKMMSVRLRGTPTGPAPEAPTEVFSGRFAFGNGNTIRNYSMTNDGEHFVLVKQQSGASLNVVLNWFETLKRVK